MDIMSALATAGEAIKMVKHIKDLDHSLDKAEMKSAMAELHSNLADMKMALSDARIELHEAGQQISELKAALIAKAALKEVGDFSYACDHSGQPKGLPVCTACLADSGKQIRLSYIDETIALAQCPKCSTNYFNAVRK